MVPLSGTIEFNAPAANQVDFPGDVVLREEDAIVLHGVVMDDETGKPAPQVLVELHARRNDGIEYLVCRTLSGSDGKYLLYVDTKKVTDDTDAIIIRADTNHVTV